MRALAAGWLLAAFVMLGVTLVRATFGSGGRGALSALLPLYFMSLPAGHLGLEAVIWGKTALYVRAGYVPHLAAEGAVLWSALAALGWAQWFVVLPWLARCARRGAGRLLARHSAR